MVLYHLYPLTGWSLQGQHMIQGMIRRFRSKLFSASTVVLLMVSMFLCSQVHAVGSIAAKSAGGVIFSHAQGLEFEKKEIFLSPSRVKVICTVRNTMPTPITSRVRFHVPHEKYGDLGGQLWDEEAIAANSYYHAQNNSWTLDPPDPNKIPFMNFSATVNGAPVKVQKTIEVKKDKQDIKEILINNKLPLHPGIATCSNNLPIHFDIDNCKVQISKLHELGLVDEQDTPLWRKDIFFEWEQVFPPQENVVIEYSYHPATGVVFVHFDDEKPPLESLAFGLIHAGCFLSKGCFGEEIGEDHNLVKWILKKFAQDLQTPDKNQGTYLYQVNYLLKEGDVNECSIKSFVLTLEHPEGGMVQTCPLWTDMAYKRLSPTQVTTTRKNFVPKNNITAFNKGDTVNINK